MRILPTSREILDTLDICPWIPVDVLAVLVGTRSRVSVYQALARLTAAGLIQRRQVRPGPLAGARPVSLWAVTSLGQGIRGTAITEFPTLCGHDDQLRLGSQYGRSRRNIADPLRIAAARALAAWLTAQAMHGQCAKLAAWDAPWIERDVARRTVRFPAAAVTKSAVTTGEHRQLIVILPDLGTAPVIRFRSALLRLVESLAQAELQEYCRATRLLVVTTNVDGHAARQKVWTRLIDHLRTQTGLSQLPTTILEWPQVHRLLGLAQVGGAQSVTDHRPRRQPTARRMRADELLDLLGRHPFLNIEQLAALLAITQSRARELRQSLVAQGLVRIVPIDDLAGCSPTRLGEHRSIVADIAELTAAGRRHVAHQFGLPVAVARRHQGLFGGSPRHRHRALRHLAHTIGANQVFVSLALEARAANTGGADEALEEWRPAAACERRHCKPDGYGCYRRGDVRFGFFLEYDRGTERASQYDAKLAGFYAFRNSRQAGRHYSGFPDILFVTTSAAAEQRIVTAAKRARGRFGGGPLRILVTTADRIAADRYGILGPIWRSPECQNDAGVECRCWLPNNCQQSRERS